MPNDLVSIFRWFATAVLRKAEGGTLTEGHIGWLGTVRWMLLAEAANLAVMLLVVRVCGYRLVKLDRQTATVNGY